MTRYFLHLSSVALFALGVSSVAVYAEKGQSVADAAVKANPELVSALSKELGTTQGQAAGAAGALFGVAKSKLKADEFAQISKAIPGMDSLLKAAPAMAAGGLGVPGLGGSGGGAAAAAAAFSKLGLGPDLVTKAIPILTSALTKGGGANVASLFANALK
jgi:hypothetical protein